MIFVCSLGYSRFPCSDSKCSSRWLWRPVWTNCRPLRRPFSSWRSLWARCSSRRTSTSMCHMGTSNSGSWSLMQAIPNRSQFYCRISALRSVDLQFAVEEGRPQAERVANHRSRGCLFHAGEWREERVLCTFHTKIEGKMSDAMYKCLSDGSIDCDRHPISQLAADRFISVLCVTTFCFAVQSLSSSFHYTFHTLLPPRFKAADSSRRLRKNWLEIECNGPEPTNSN